MNAALVELVDKIGPINNHIRSEKDPIKKIELMWDMGEQLHFFLQANNYKLHSLLYELYDPHSTFKNTNVTRDLASYCYRYYKFFVDREEIRKMLTGLKSYKLFRDAFPLLSNPKYRLNPDDKAKVYDLLKRDEPFEKVQQIITKNKESIVKIERGAKRNDFQSERQILSQISRTIDQGVQDNKTQEEIIGELGFTSNDLTNVVLSLMNLAYESPGKNVTPNWKFESDKLISLFNLSFGSTESKARFRKWVLNTNDLLRLAEKLQCVINNDLKYLKKKYFSDLAVN